LGGFQDDKWAGVIFGSGRETGVEDAAEVGVMLLRALRHLTRERRGREVAKRLLLYDIQGQSVQHSLRAQQHMPNGAQQQADVRVHGRPRAGCPCARLFRAVMVNFERPGVEYIRLGRIPR
jgi:hypothetical protein